MIMRRSSPRTLGLAVTLLALLSGACAQPADVVLYEENARAKERQLASRRGVKEPQAPIPRAKPRRGRDSSSSIIESKPLPPSGGASRQQALSGFSRGKTSVTAFDRKGAAGKYQPVPASGVHIVTKKQTVYAISRLYGVPVRSLLIINKLEPPYILALGQKIKVPAQRTHLVSKGDTVYSISRRYDVSRKELMRLNGVGTPFTIKIGQTLLLPATQAAVTTVAAADGGEGDRSNDPPAAAAPSRPAPSPESQIAIAPPRQVIVPPSTNIPRPKGLSRGGFMWPISGRVISRFGPKRGGLHNDGINIAAPRGTPILAAQNGVVAYRGNELRGFGNLILIKHAKGYMTAYAHTDKILVKRGQRVSRGQTIAKVGSSGNVAKPQLHFEIRKGRRAVNPGKYLRQRRAALDGSGTVKVLAKPSG